MRFANRDFASELPEGGSLSWTKRGRDTGRYYGQCPSGRLEACYYLIQRTNLHQQ